MAIVATLRQVIGFERNPRSTSSESAIDIVGIGDRLRQESVIAITGIRTRQTVT